MTRYFGLVVFAVALASVPSASRAAPILYTANLSGPAEEPPVASPAIGFAEVIIDLEAHTLQVQATFSGLLGPTTQAHIHTPTATPGTGTAGVATVPPAFPGFPLGVTSGTYNFTLDTLDPGIYNAPFLAASGGTAAGAEAALAAGLEQGRAYFNIHTTSFPGGEIRGFLTPVPEPSTLVLTGLGVVSLAGYVWRRRRQIA